MASPNKQSSSKSPHHGAKAPPKQSPKPKNQGETRDSFKPPLVLSGPNNYSKWSREMKAALASKNKRGFVDGSIAAPAKDQKAYREWKRCNDLVLSWIVKAVSPEIAKSVHGKHKAIDVWRDLKKEFEKVQKLNRSIHRHPLTLKPSGAPYMCSGCRELGFGPSYCCENCNYVLHEDCANVIANNSLVFHRFFKESNFMFYKERPDGRERYCNACGNDVLGFFYHCHTTGKDLHPCCFKLKGSISDKGGHVTLKLCNTVPKNCRICRGKKVENNIKGWSYVSSGGDYCCHVSCFKKAIIDKWKDNYFSKGKMSLQTKTQITLTGKEMVKVGGSSQGSEISKIFIKTTMSWVFRIVFTVVFGNPTPLIQGALEHIFNYI